MPCSLTRKELYDLVWGEPMKTLAGRLELSDVGLAKACRKADIPRPPRGYWAKLAAGKKVARDPLPIRGPGMSDQVEAGVGRYGYYRHYTDQEILNSNPEPPAFEDDIEDVAKRIKSIVQDVTIPRFPERAHRLIGRLLDADEERRRKQIEAGYSFSWNAPLFDDAFERRRLRVLNALMTALERSGMRPVVQGRDGRGLCVYINDTAVSFTLDSTSQKPDPYRWTAIETRGPSDKLRCSILTRSSSSNALRSWEDTEKARLETCLTEIVRELILAGERQYREGRQHHYEWLLERKASIIEENKKREAEAERAERERLAALERARINRLLRDAAAFRKAADIRSFVADVDSRYRAGEVPISEEELMAWRGWALKQAESLDPVRSGRFVASIKD